jgi:ABC-2 type transport system ATP-binding protein
MTDFVLDTQHLTRQFGNKLALNNLTLRIKKGGVHALIGSNGAGKSTLFRILLGFITPLQEPLPYWVKTAPVSVQH